MDYGPYIMKKRYHIIGDLKRNMLILAAASSLGLASCNSPSNNTAEDATSSDWSTGANNLSQGVITEMTETSPNNWKITAVIPSPTATLLALLINIVAPATGPV